MSDLKPDIFTYTDYRLFLKEIYNHLKSMDRKYSYRFIAHHVGSSSPSWLSDLINKRINLSAALSYQLTKFLKLSGKERDYFELLVAYDQAASIEQKNACLEKILSVKDLKIDLITRNQFDYFRYWYIPVIRELLFFYDFKDDYDSLARKLRPSIKPQEAKRAIETLVSLDLISPDRSGFFRPGTSLVRKDSSFKYIFLSTYLKSFMDLGKDALDTYEKDERDISAVTIHLTPEAFKTAQEEILALRKKLLSLSERKDINFTTSDKEAVYHCNIQLFPLTHK